MVDIIEDFLSQSSLFLFISVICITVSINVFYKIFEVFDGFPTYFEVAKKQFLSDFFSLIKHLLTLLITIFFITNIVIVLVLFFRFVGWIWGLANG